MARHGHLDKAAMGRLSSISARDRTDPLGQSTTLMSDAHILLRLALAWRSA